MNEQEASRKGNEGVIELLFWKVFPVQSMEHYSDRLNRIKESNKMKEKRGIGAMATAAVFFAGLLIGLGWAQVGATEKITLTLASWDTGYGEEAWKESVRICEQRNPNISIKLEFRPWGAYWQKILTEMAGGMGRDLYQHRTGTILSYIGRGMIKNLQPFIDKSGIDLNDYYDFSFTPFLYPPKTGDIYAVPIGAFAQTMFYNKDHFKEAGVEVPGWDLTWEMYRQMLKKLARDTDGDGKIDRYGAYSPIAIDLHKGWIYQNEGHLFSDDFKKCRMGEPEAIEAIQFLYDLIYEDNSTMRPELAVGGIDPFLVGRISTCVTGAWVFTSYEKSEDLNWDIAPLPVGKIRANATGSGTACMWSGTKHPEEAWKYLETVLSAEGQLAFGSLVMPVLKSVGNEWLQRFADRAPASREIIIREAEYAVSEEPPRFDELQKTWIDEVTLAFLNKKPLVKAIQDAVQNMDKILETW